MKKIIGLVLLGTMLVAGLLSCNAKSTNEKKGEGVMTYADYIAAEKDSNVVIETYVQAKQSWWDGKATLYTQDKDGAYFVYNLPCTEDEFAKMTVGSKIKISGFKSEWSGEIEIIDADFEMQKGNFVATPLDVTNLLGTDNLIQHQNELVSFKNMKVEPSVSGDGEEKPFLFKWDGSGREGDDLYFTVSSEGKSYKFTVESYLCGKETDVYKAVTNLQIGEVINCEGFLYWYEGVNPHITSVTKAE